MHAPEELAKPDAKPGPPEAAHSAETPQARRWRLVRYVVLCCMAAAAWRWLQSCAGVLNCKHPPPLPRASVCRPSRWLPPQRSERREP